MALAKWILIVVLLNSTGNTSNAHRTDDVSTYFLESCASAIVVKLHKDRPNEIVKIRLFDSFPEIPLEQCECRIYVYIEEFYKAWWTHTLSPRLRNYKVLVTLEDLNWPDQCDKISCLVEDNQRNGTTMCTELAENVYNYRFDLHYRRSLPLKDDYYLEMSVGVAYMPYGSDTNGCPSDEYFQCDADSLCIPSRFWCDNYSHCSDESDERDCEHTKRPPAVVVASSEDPYSANLNTEPFNSAEDYSSEEDAEASTIDSESITTVSASTVATTQRPLTPKPELTITTKRPTGAPTTPKPSKAITKATIAKKQGPTVKMITDTGKVKPSSSPPPKASSTTGTPPMTTTKTTTTTRPISTTTTTTPILITQTAPTQASREEPSSKTEATATSTTSTAATPAMVATTSKPTTSSTPKSEASTRALVHFSFTERPSIAIVGKTSDRDLTSSDRSPSQSGQDATRASSDTLATTSATMEPRPATNERRKKLYDLEVVTFDDSNSIVSTVPNVIMKHNSRNSSAKPPYPWSDRYDSRSRNSSAVSSNSAPNQWVLVALCLILVFIYFFL